MILGKVRAATVRGKPCTKVAGHVEADGATVRYLSTNNCVACAHQAAASQTQRRQQKREAERLRRHGLAGESAA